jgi:hypothetical protein
MSTTDLRPEQLPAAASDLFQRLMSCLSFDPLRQPRQLLISLHAQNLLRLAQDIIFLESHGRSASTPTIARAMLESLFKLGVAVKNPDLAARMTLLEWEWDAIQSTMPGSYPRDLAKIRLTAEYVPIGQRVGTLSRRWGFQEEEYRQIERKFTTKKWADHAGLGFLYKHRYAELSNYSHAVSTAFIAPAVPAFVLAVVTLCLLEASERVAARFNTEIPSDQHTALATLRQLFDSYHQSGEYPKLFAQDMVGAPTPRPEKSTDKYRQN